MSLTPHDHVERVLEWTTSSGDLTELDAYTLERFLWYELPAKWSADRIEQQAVVDALAQELTAAGRERLAARCGSEETLAILDAWDRRPAEGFAAFRKGLARSPVNPPDVEPTSEGAGLEWGSVMGADEAVAHTTVGVILAAAFEDGFIQPGHKGWRAEQQRLAREALTRPAPDSLTGGSMLDAILEERLSLWTERTRSKATTSLLTRVGKLLLHAVPAPEGVDEALEPLRRLLELCRGGIRLTEDHMLELSVVQELSSRLGWGLEGCSSQGEDDEPLVHELHLMVKRAGLVRRKKDTLVLTTRGRHASSDTAARWQCAARDWIAGDDFDAHAGEIALALLLEAGGSMDSRELHETTVELLVDQGWASRSDRVPVDAGDVGWALGTLRRRGRLHGFIAGPAGAALTAVGQRAAIAALRARATGPRELVP